MKQTNEKGKFENVADGKDRGVNKSPRSLAEAMGFKGSDKYNTSDAEEYEKALKSMNLVDLQSHAIGIGIKPNCERRALQERLKKEFRKTNSSYVGALQTQKGNDIKKKDRKKALDILSGGR